MAKYLVVWMTNDEVDFWEACETELEALQRYEQIRDQDDTYTVSLCVCLQSTDYPTVDRKSLRWK